MKIENCNRCCSEEYEILLDKIICKNCFFEESFEVWQLKGWRCIFKYPPSYSGTIFVYGKKIGRCSAIWDSKNKVCNLKDVTHWLRTPDPRVQVGFNDNLK